MTDAGVDYGLDVEPRVAVLGEPLLAWLSCRASAEASGVLTFDHRSLIVEARRNGLVEPLLVFPNRFAVEQGDRLVRMSAPGGVEDLHAGEERRRSVDLLATFPDAALAPGELTVSYRLEEAEPAVQIGPVTVTITSGPEAVPRLIGLLSADAGALRSRAAAVLSTMTAHDFGYRGDAGPDERGDAVQRWWTWWHQVGSRLPWSFGADGATFAVPPEPAAPGGVRLGGIAYPDRQPL